jgi:hypothetical protein
MPLYYLVFLGLLAALRRADETACATTGKSFACIGGACFSLPTPACGRISSHLLTVAALIGAPTVREGLLQYTRLAKRLPVIVQRNAWTMAHERYNTDWVEEMGVGVVVRNFAT